MRIAALVLFFMVRLAEAQDTAGVGAVVLTVTDPQGRPVQGAEVCIRDSARCGRTDVRGESRFGELRPGPYRLEIRAELVPPFSTAAIEVRAGLDVLVDVELPKIDAPRDSISVTAAAFVAPEEVKNSGFLVPKEELLVAAGAQQDVSRFVQSLPGVVIGAADFRNDIVVRGGSPLENLFVVDNIEIPNINSFANFASAGGTGSILDAQLVQDVTFLTGGYPAPYVNRTSGVLQVTQREGTRDKFRSRIGLSDPGLGTILEGPLKQGRGSWIVSVRRSFLDAFTKDIGIGGVPVLYTFNGKLLYDLSPRDRVWLVSISGKDRIRLGAKQGRKITDENEELNNLDIRYRGWRSATGVNWQRLFGNRGVGLFGVTHSDASVGQTVKDLVRTGVPPAGADVERLIASSPEVFREASREAETTVKYDYTAYAGFLDKFQAGGSVKLFRIRYDAASPFGNDSRYSLVAQTNPFTLKRSFSAYQHAAYLQTSQNVGSRLSVTLGGRVDNYQYLQRTRFSPRAGLSLRLSDRLSLRASFGTYFQQPLFLFISAFPGNRALTPFRADHIVAGFNYVPRETLHITVEAYRKTYKDYPVSTQFPSLSLASVGDTFNVREILFPLTSAGRGRSQGIELLAEKKFGVRWFGQTNLSFSQARQGGLDGVRRPSTYDFPAVFNALGAYRFNDRWQVSARLSYLSGRPYTPFDPVLSTRQSRGIYDLSQVNALRTPAYFRLDVRAERTFTLRGQPLKVYVGAQNALNRRNIAGYSWSRRENRVLVNEQLRLFPILGFDWILRR